MYLIHSLIHCSLTYQLEQPEQPEQPHQAQAQAQAQAQPSFLPIKDIFYNSNLDRAVLQFLRCFVSLFMRSVPGLCIF